MRKEELRMNQNRRGTRMMIVSLFLLGSALTVSAANQQSSVEASHKIILRVAQVAALGLSDSSPMELVVAPRAAAGSVISGSNEGNRILRYTTVNSEGSTRAITVHWGARDSAPTGTSLKIVAARVPDRCGLPAPEVSVSSMPQRLISEIPSSQTGANGAVLRYRLDIDNDSQVATGTMKEVLVTFTLTDD
jgi:hypothetical protein